MLRRVFGTSTEEPVPSATGAGVRVLDSEQARAWWRGYLGWLPYRWWRGVVHTSHYVRVLGSLRPGGPPMVVHECATRPWIRRLILGAARVAGRPVHLLLLDVDRQTAADAQTARGRRIRAAAFDLHCRRWLRLIDAVETDGDAIHDQTASIVLLDRAAAARLEAIRFSRAHPG
jgi:hypothetical protein